MTPIYIFIISRISEISCLSGDRGKTRSTFDKILYIPGKSALVCDRSSLSLTVDYCLRSSPSSDGIVSKGYSTYSIDLSLVSLATDFLTSEKLFCLIESLTVEIEML